MLVVLDRILDVEKTSTDEIIETRDLIIALTQRTKISDERQIYYMQLSNNNRAVLLEAFKIIRNLINQNKTTGTSKTRQDRFLALLGKSFAYTLSEADLRRIQTLVNELRNLITASDRFEDDHRRRVLERLEDLQRELHRRLSNLDRFYGLIGDAGVLLGKFGHDAKPFLDRIREIVEIVWRSQANAEQLPASAKPALLTSEPPPEE
jgi:hypothetical protein